mmetsp:Transcript_11947/g.29417  ORF Transcript_11947/g.29417 Transcript_11947/m.29417 type:complete len:274 (+) Transcript_11947:168-989(+)|eukprot:CAMPEP_0114505768 /NCGR_PEP_ID=MMETSP0109-20121206/11037_1 /TAXON_ID=29199 /ORGANISM="Chlorarachnion reptans, Strain CCCM449" /LENGTH=273 /DNA_ID=CAMNT_0001684245 /DNA_START=150 /DNA_END=971 /DNA_ORIENTATION=-
MSYAPVDEGKRRANNEAIQSGVAYEGQPIAASASSHGAFYGHPVTRQPDGNATSSVAVSGYNYDESAPNVGDSQGEIPVAYAVPVAPGAGDNAGRGPGAIASGYFPTPLCGCFENVFPSCCMATFCWCFPLARVRTHAHIEEPSVRGWPGSDYTSNLALLFMLWVLDLITKAVANRDVHAPGSAVGVFSIIGIFVVVVRTAFVVVTRMEIRRRKGITENCCCCDNTIWDDLCSTFWCFCCVVAQLDRTEFDYEEGDCGRAFRNPRDEAVRVVP